MDIIDSLVLVAPAIVPKTGALSYKKSKFLIELSRFFGKSNRYLIGEGNWRPFRSDLSVANIDLCASNPKRLPYRDVVFTRNSEERVGGVTAQWAGEFLASSEVINTKAFLSSIDIPITMISAEIDHLVDTNTNQISCDSIFPNCTRVDVNNSGHCLFQESDEILSIIFDSVDDLLVFNSKPKAP
jgi:pimeloyl-ACP methyl ester carboxylesterase